MITGQLQLILIIASVATLVFIINMIRKYNLELKYSLIWLFFCIVNILLAVFTDIAFFTADMLGISEPVNAIFLLSFGFQFFLIFSLSLAVSKLANQLTQLVQEVGIIKKELEKIANDKSMDR